MAFTKLQEAIEAALVAELGTGNLLEGVVAVKFSACPRVLPTE